MTKKVKAFTIMEVTVAMLLAAIVISITYTCFNIISISYLSFKSCQSQLVEISQLVSVLNKDIDKATIAQNNNGKLILTGEKEPVTYQILPEMVLRITAVTDTFKVQTTALKMLYEGKEIGSYTNADESIRIDEIAFDIAADQKSIPYHYLKFYSSQDLIKRNPNAQY